MSCGNLNTGCKLNLLQVVSGGKEVTLPSGTKYKDIKIGGGSPVQKGYLMVLDFK